MSFVSTEKLKKYFKFYGSVQDAVVMKDPVTKRSRGFGFITFHDISAVDNVLANEPHTVDGRKVEAKRAVPRSEMGKDMHPPARSAALPSAPPSNASTPVMSMNKTVSNSAPGTPLSSPQVSLTKSHAAHGQTTPSSAAIYESRTAADQKLNMEDYAYNKIFVGGLHYDTRDGKFFVSVS
jgi:RNA recognition motif-containing protein